MASRIVFVIYKQRRVGHHGTHSFVHHIASALLMEQSLDKCWDLDDWLINKNYSKASIWCPMTTWEEMKLFHIPEEAASIWHQCNYLALADKLLLPRLEKVAHLPFYMTWRGYVVIIRLQHDLGLGLRHNFLDGGLILELSNALSSCFHLAFMGSVTRDLLLECHLQCAQFADRVLWCHWVQWQY